jgi:rubrerythrin
VSRLPRAQEFLKTGFNAEAATAARLRAAASRAEGAGKPNLARALRELAAEKDDLAATQLAAAGQLHGPEEELAAAIAEERYENDALYPRMLRDVDDATAGVFRDVVARQQAHAERLEGLLDAVTRSRGDLPA